jgi:hypothetical protein
MSREQRRIDRKAQARGGGAGGGSSRRTPVKVGGGSRIPTVPLAIAGGIVVVVALIAYLVLQADNSPNVDAATKASQDSSASIPGTYVPDQGRAHFPFPFSLTETPLPFCPGVKWSGAPEGQPTFTAVAGTPTNTPTPGPSPTPPPSGHGNVALATVGAGDCRASNPPSSGKHLNVQSNVDVGGGNLIKIPADPDVYPPDVVIPRDSIPHILEHAGVFVGYNCADGDSACQDVVQQLTDVVNARIDRNDHSSRVVMARDPDLVVGTIGMASWTRVLTMTYQDFNKNTVDDFIAKNSCRVDWEGFCR